MSEPKKLRPRPSLVPSAAAPSPSEINDSKKKPRSQGGCGNCEACNAQDCRQCVYCLDMRKYGGPNRLRKRCLHRRCTGNKGNDGEKEKNVSKRSKREIKQPKKLTPNHSSSRTYDNDDGECRPSPGSDGSPPAKRRKLEYPVPRVKKTSSEPVIYKYDSGKRLAPAPVNDASRPRIPSPPKLDEPPSPEIQVAEISSRHRQANETSGKIIKKKFVPKSLPFLVNTDIAGVIVRYEIRARNFAVQEAKGLKSADMIENSGKEWKLEEVINFFRGVYLYGWGNWKLVRKFIKTKSVLETKIFANAKQQRYPELKSFFGAKNLSRLHMEHPTVMVKRMASAISIPSCATLIDPSSTGWKMTLDEGLNNLSRAVLEVLGDEKSDADAEERSDSQDRERDNVSVSSEELESDWLKDSTPPFLLRPQDPTRGTFNNGKVSICLGSHVIEADTCGAPTQTKSTAMMNSYARPKPEIFDPNYRPSAPTVNSQQIYIPGNRVYARWLNKDDPGSYGTWYPGFVQSSRVSPDQRDYDEGLCGFPSLLYHVRFDDGVLSKDIRAEDIMMQDQYEIWLKDLEDYYALPLVDDSARNRLSNGQRVYAKWLDPTDPDMHGRWIRGIVISSNDDHNPKNDVKEITYHVKFADGDEDEELKSEFVLEDTVYKTLLKKKIEQGKHQNVSGFDLIQAASKISSPIKSPRAPLNGSNHSDIILDINDIDEDNKSFATIESELLCHEVLEPPSPIPAVESDDSSAPEVHYGLYIKCKPTVITPSFEPPRKDAEKSFQSNCAIVKQLSKKDDKAMEYAASPEPPKINPKMSTALGDVDQNHRFENSKKADALAALVELSQNVDKEETDEAINNSANVLVSMNPSVLQMQPRSETELWCERWAFDIFQESFKKSDITVREMIESCDCSDETYRQTLIAWQLTQMRITKEFINEKECALGLSLSDKEKSEINYVCTESFTRLVSEIMSHSKTNSYREQLTLPKLSELYNRICVQVRTETVTCH